MLKEGLSTFTAPQAEIIREKVNRILLDINKPSRYIGQEIGSINKNWEESTIRTAIAFPDMYEIGISNLGHRILYHVINNYAQANFLADRVYAPDVDFRKKLQEENVPLYGVESFQPLCAFDIVAFSLQYELSYPTILAMLEMGQIPVKSADRKDSDPLVMAGGPGSYNPEPLTEFVDIFLIGDGESVLTEVLSKINTLKNEGFDRESILFELTKLQGIYIPRFYNAQGYTKPVPNRAGVPVAVTKRINTLTDENCPVDFPVSYPAIVHDRAVLEIRRGCGRMCRFCQSCFVNLPVRERSPEKIVKLAGELLKNTGYDEYSLLSLSSNDYGNIESLVCALNNNHAQSGASISLPSQRADAFSLELAQQVQSVRKSTLTFAPEAGSQRLRDAINKNLTEEHILNAIFSAYSAGWSSVKLYFMIGLPTETYEDLDAILDLLSTIKEHSKRIKSEKGLNKPLELTCTVSIFVPKPFTPFQWCAQNSVEDINQKVDYLRNKVKSIKGVRLNFHDSFLSQLEAVFAKGDRSLNALIESAYKSGSYLDAWNEHFNKKLWFDCAEETGISFDGYSQLSLDTDTELPWDFINVGVNKEWLKNEYTNALQSLNSTPCDEQCTTCGVCSTLGVRKEIKSSEPVSIDEPSKDTKTLLQTPERFRLTLHKSESLRFISHLDWQRVLYKAFRKTGIKLAFTQGFNPSPKISISLALPIFLESRCEFAEIEVMEKISAAELCDRLNALLPEGSAITSAKQISRQEKSADQLVDWAEYSATPVDADSINEDEINSAISNLIGKEEIIVSKVKDRKVQKKDIRPFIKSVDSETVEGKPGLRFILKTGQHGNLRADEFVQHLTPSVKWHIIRERLLDKDFKDLV